MKSILACVVWIFLNGAAWANEVALVPVPPAKMVNCQVSIRGGFSGSGRCMSDEVVTSISSTNPLMVRCGRIEVSCPTTVVRAEPALAEASAGEPE